MKIPKLYMAICGMLFTAQMANAQQNIYMVNSDGEVNAISVSSVNYATFSVSDKWVTITNDGIEGVNKSMICATCSASLTADADIKSLSITREVGVCYSKYNAVPTIDDNCKKLGSAMDSYTFTLTSLDPGTTYYYRVYVKLANSVLYGDVVKETTSGIKPTGSKFINGHKFVDLGLPSGLLWAETNIGAEEAADYGNYYSWGGTKAQEYYGYYVYEFLDLSQEGTIDCFSTCKYNSTDGKTSLDKEDDAAYINWNSSCHMPTSNDFDELLNSSNCTWTWTSKTNSDGTSINGYKVTSTKNGNSIFLPASGGCIQARPQKPSGGGSAGNYWSSMLDSSDANCYQAYSLYFSSSDHSKVKSDRCDGYTIRPVVKAMTISESIDNAHWYYIKHHTNEKDLYWCKSADDYSVTVAKPASSIDGSGFGDEYLWCIMGNATDGYTFYNKAAGSSYTLARSDDKTSVASLSAEAANNTFKMIRSQGDSVSGFAFYLDETTPYYLNAQDGSIKGSTKADNSSTIRFIEPLEFTAERVLDWASGYQNYTTPDASSLPTGAVYTANVYLDNADSLTAYQTAYNNLSALVSEDRLNTLIDKNKKVAAGRSGVEEGTYYRLQCVEPKDKSSNGNYCFLSWDSNDQTGYPATVLEQTVKTSAASVWQFEKNGAYYRLKNLNTGKYLGSIKNTTSYRIPFTAADDEGLFTLSEYSGAAGHFKLLGKGTTQDYLFAENGTDDNHRLSVGNTEADGAAAWYIFKATELDVPLNTVGEASYASIYLPFAVTAPEGTKAYTGTLNEGNNFLKMEEQETIPASTGAILVGEQGANSATMTIVAKPSTTVDDNALLGTFTNKAVGASSVLTLGRNSENTSEIGLFTFTGTTIPANRAYLAMPSAGSISLYFFGDEVTDIESSTAEGPDGTPIYDLSGRRVIKATRGVYIKNGKKVFVK